MSGADARAWGRSRAGWVVGALLATAYCCLLCVRHASHSRLWLDEFFAWNLLTDPSWSHALRAWEDGADSGGPLYYTLGRLLLLLFGPSVVALKLFSTMCLVAAALLWCNLLLSHYGRPAGVCAVALLWAGNPELLAHGGDIRFYGLFLLTASLLSWTTERVMRQQMPPRRTWILCFGASSALLLSHVLGAVYAGMICVSLPLCRGPRASKRAAIAGVISSFPLLLLLRRALRGGALNAMPSPPPTWHDLLRLYRWLPYGPHVIEAWLNVGSAVCLLGLFTAGLAVLSLNRRGHNSSIGGEVESGREPLLFAFLPAPLVLFAISFAGRPILGDRYLLPYLLSFTALLALVLGALLKRVGDRGMARSALVLITAALALGLHMLALRQVGSVPPSQFHGRLEAGVPVLVTQLEPFFQLQYYDSNAQQQFFYVGEVESADPSSMARSIARAGYWKGHMLSPTDLAKLNGTVELITEPGEQPSWLARSGWCPHGGDVVRVGNRIYDLQPMHRCR